MLLGEARQVYIAFQFRRRATPLWVIPVAKGSDGIRAVPAK
jgi:hypothetical protein